MLDHQMLKAQLGSANTPKQVERLRQFAQLTNNALQLIKSEALPEDWGVDDHLLEKYLSVQIPWSIEQGRYTVGDGQFYTTAGHLQTRYGTPLYLVFQENKYDTGAPWVVVTGGANISAPDWPTPPDIPTAPEVISGAEIIMQDEHILDDHAERAPYFRSMPRVTQLCAIAGAIQWSLNRELHTQQWYHGQMNYIVPLYLASREDITAPPDLVAPIQVTPSNLLVRTLLEPQMAYANSRVAVQRRDKLPHWMLSSVAPQRSSYLQGRSNRAVNAVR